MKSTFAKALLLLLIASSSASLGGVDSEVVSYEPTVVSLSGTILKESYGDDSSPIDRGRHAWILRLDGPISVPAKPDDEIDTEEKNVVEVHLNVSHAKHPMTKEQFGRTRFTATGILYHRINTHHLRPIVMLVSDLKPAK